MGIAIAANKTGIAITELNSNKGNSNKQKYARQPA
jgi:hypothetical protein